MKRRDLLKVGGAVVAAVSVGNVAIAEVKDDGFKWTHLKYAEEGDFQYYGGYETLNSSDKRAYRKYGGYDDYNLTLEDLLGSDVEAEKARKEWGKIK